MKTYPLVLTIAGSDSGGGAGIQADIKAISATGSYAASAVTAVTVQNTLGVRAVHNVPQDIIRGQIAAVFEDMGADAVKVGMLGTAETVRTVFSTLRHFGVKNIVLDPVMVATSGDRLMDGNAVGVLLEEAAPYARVLTPNIPEAEILSGWKISSEADLPEMAALLSERISSERKVSVLMKAGHLEDDMLTDYFFNAEKGHTVKLVSRRVKSRNTHGTGCTLSSALASYIARGYDLDDAARLAKEYISKAVESGAEFIIGHGHGPVNHFWML